MASKCLNKVTDFLKAWKIPKCVQLCPVQEFRAPRGWEAALLCPKPLRNPATGSAVPEGPWALACSDRIRLETRPRQHSYFPLRSAGHGSSSYVSSLRRRMLIQEAGEVGSGPSVLPRLKPHLLSLRMPPGWWSVFYQASFYTWNVLAGSSICWNGYLCPLWISLQAH